MTDFLAELPTQMTIRAPEVRGKADYEKTRAAVQDFEAFFITQSFEQMYNTLPVNDTFGGGQAEKIFRSMLINEYGQMTAKSGGIGLTDKIMAQLIQQQQVDSPAEQ